MKRAFVLFLGLMPVMGTVMFLVGPAEAADGVSIKTISSKSVPYGGKIAVKPLVTTTGMVKIVSARLAVKLGSTYVTRSAPAVMLGAGNYQVTTSVKYTVESRGEYGEIRTRAMTQSLTVREEPKPVVVPDGPCGPTIRKPDGTAWTCTFADDFDGTALDRTKWSSQQTALNGISVGGECLVDSPNNISVSDGTLRLTVREEDEPFMCGPTGRRFLTQYTSGGVTTYGKFSQTYGRFAFRAKFPGLKVPGIQSSLWLYPEKLTYGSWPASGEIDVAEFYSSVYDRAIPYLHYNAEGLNFAGPTGMTNWLCKLDTTQFHDYVAEWTPYSIKISFDGQVCLEHVIDPAPPLTGSQPFDKPFTMIITQTLGSLSGANIFSSLWTPLPQTTVVDWVRAWA